MKKILFTVVLGLVLFSGQNGVQAKVSTSHVVNDAVDVLTKYFTKDIKKVDQKLGRTAVLVSISADFDPEMKNYLQNKLEEGFAKSHRGEIVGCFSCQTAHAYSDGNQIVVEKGLASSKVARNIAQELSLNTFLTAELAFTGKQITLSVKAVDSADSKLLWNKTYRVHSRFVTDRGLIFSLDLGPAYSFNAATTEDSYMAGVALFVGERFHGWGRLGVAFSTVFSATNFNFNQSTGPYISVNINEVTGMSLPWGEFSIFVNPGYAVSQKSIGVLARGGIVFDMGSFMHITAETQYPVYSQNPTKEYPKTAMVSFGFDFY